MHQSGHRTRVQYAVATDVLRHVEHDACSRPVMPVSPYLWFPILFRIVVLHVRDLSIFLSVFVFLTVQASFRRVDITTLFGRSTIDTYY